MSSCSRNIVVLGAGVSGLSFAYHLNAFKGRILSVKNAVLPKVTILEKSQKVGGWMQSSKNTETGAVFENGPRTLRATGFEAMSTLAMVEELDLDNDIISVKRSSPAAKNRMIYAKNKLNQLPNSLLGLMKTCPPLSRPLYYYGWKEVRTTAPPELKDQDESIHSFVSRRFGSEVADYLADPVFRGIIAGDVRSTSIKALLPRLKAIEDRYGSIILNFNKLPEQASDVVKESRLCRKALDEKWSIFNFKSGLGTLPHAICNKLVESGVDIKLGTSCTRLQFDGTRFLVHTDKEVIHADVVVAAINAKSLSKLLVDHESLSSLLEGLPAADVATVGLEYPISPKSIPQAFGHLIPSCEPESNLGVIYDSVIFPEHDREDRSTTRLTCMIGGAWFEEVLGSNPSLSQVEDVAIKSIAKQLNIKQEPVYVKANILREAIPQYPVGHTDTVAKIDSLIVKHGLPLAVIGPSYDKPGANHCIHLAKVQARKVLEQWDIQDYLSSRPSHS